MICARCARRAIMTQSRTHPPARQIFKRCISVTPQHDAAQASSASATATSTPQRFPPAATSTAAAQPFSTPLTPSPTASGIKAITAGPKRPKVVSSVPEGTELKGLNYFKNKTDPVAMADHEYPDWLWTVLQPKKSLEGQKDEVDPRLYSKSANARRLANKRLRQKQALEGNKERPLPIYEQSIDLPSGDGTEAGAYEAAEARRKLTQAMREKRRKDIKERNFLQSMR